MSLNITTERALKTAIAPSIFNDAIGPIMRGPSSSHCAAAHRIGRLCLDLLDGVVTSLVVEYDENGALKTTHSGQGTDMGLYSGILGYDIDDDRLQSFAKGLSEAGIRVEVKYLDYGAKHPNNYRLTIANEAEVHIVEAISTGGGMIEIQKIDGAAVCMVGDYYELLVFYEGEPTELQLQLERVSSFEFIENHQSSKTSFIEVKSAVDFDADFLTTLASLDSVQSVRVLKPVLPILARADLDVPFISCNEMLEYNQGRGLALWELAVAYESQRGNISTEEVFEKMRAIVRIMKKSIQSGLAGTAYQDRILQK